LDREDGEHSTRGCCGRLQITLPLAWIGKV
jgi:hypothetical protein